MTEINAEKHVFTLINTFTVKPENQEELIRVLTVATEKVMNKIDGFVSANIHRGLDETGVANYGQWKSKQHFLAMQVNPEAKIHMKIAAELSEKFEPLVYKVDSTHQPKK